MKIKQTIGLLMWAAMAACTSDMPFEEMTVPEQVISAVEDLVPVEFSASTGCDLTRAATSIVTFTSGEAVKVCVRPGGASDYTGYDFTAATSSQNVTLNAPAAPAAKPYFPPGEGTTVEAYAYYPATAGSAATFSVADNQTTNANYKASDLMYAANRTITKGSTTGTLLTMQHLMAQLALTVNVAQGSGLTISSVTVVAKKSVTFTPSAGTATVTGNAGNIIALSWAGTGYVLIPQQTISGVSIKVATGSGTAAETATYNFTSTDNFVAGKSYPITLTVSAQQLGATSAISDWNGQQSVVVEPTGELNFSTIAPVTYDGTAKTPSVTLKDANGATVPSAGYDLEYKNNTNAGTAIILAVGKGNYAGKVAVTTFTINPKTLTDAMVGAISAQTYTRSQITPSVTVTDGSALTLNTDYTVSYGENINVASGGSATVTGTGNYTGNVVKNFTISPKSISSMTLNLTQTSATYTGSAITASVSSLKDGTYSLSSSTDFTVSGTTSATNAAANASAAVTQNTITVNGTGNYTGSKNGTWSIARATPTLSINKTSLPLTMSSATGTITVTRSGDGAVTATSSNTGVATTSVSGTTVTVTAVFNGSATITVKMNQGTNYTAYTNSDKTCSVSASGFISMRQNPLWWVAQYNMAQNKTSFVASHSTSSQYCFNWTDACAEAVANYHLPTRAEQMSIIPCDQALSGGTNIFDLSETLASPKEFSEVACTVGGSSVSARTSVIGKNASGDYYAVRFINSDYASAWHYKWVTSPCKGVLIESYLVSCTTVADAKTILAGLASSTIFTGAANASGANQTPESTTVTTSAFTQRFLPACGSRHNSGAGGSGYADYSQGSSGSYWSATEKNGDTYYSGYSSFNSSSLRVTNNSKSFGFSVRLFRDN
jgi:hypothetical protein